MQNSSMQAILYRAILKGNNQARICITVLCKQVLCNKWNRCLLVHKISISRQECVPSVLYILYYALLLCIIPCFQQKNITERRLLQNIQYSYIYCCLVIKSSACNFYPQVRIRPIKQSALDEKYLANIRDRLVLVSRLVMTRSQQVPT